MSKCPICGNEADLDGSCDHFVPMYDATFPFASGESSCTLDVSSYLLRTEVLGRLVATRDAVLIAMLEGRVTVDVVERLGEPLAALVTTVKDHASIDDDEVETDSYFDLHAFRKYLDDRLAGVPEPLERTSFEQNIPGASSAYYEFWAQDASAAASYLRERIAADTAALHALLP